MNSRLCAFVVLALTAGIQAEAAEKLPKDIQAKLASDAHPIPRELGPGWVYMKEKPRLTSGERQFRRETGGYVIGKARVEDNLADTMHRFATYADRVVARSGKTLVKKLSGVGDEAIVITGTNDPVIYTVYLRVREAYVTLGIQAREKEVLGICRAYAKTMEANAKKLLGERVAMPPPIARDRGKPAAADERMFKKDRASASGSSSTRIWAQHAAGKVKLLGRGQLIAGEDCVLRVEFEAHKKPPAGVHFRARPYLGNADITVRDLWGRTVPMTALGEKVVVAADKHARRLKPIVPDSETEFQVDLTGWWQLSRPGTYMIDIQWPIFNSTGTQTGQIEARRYVFEVRER